MNTTTRHRSRLLRRRAIAGAVAAAGLASAFGAAAPPAEAAATYTHNNSYSYSAMKNTPHVGSGLVIANLYNNTYVTMLCWLDTENVTSRSYSNYSSPRWFKVRSGNGQVGYVHSSYVFNQTKVSHC